MSLASNPDLHRMLPAHHRRGCRDSTAREDALRQTAFPAASSLDDAHDVAVGGLDVGEEVAAGGWGGAGEGLQALAVAQQARQELAGMELGVGRQRIDESTAQAVEGLNLQQRQRAAVRSTLITHCPSPLFVTFCVHLSQ